MAEPFVSIIVPVYKVPEQYLRKCIESTMMQTLQNIEILLVDDGSPDQCGEICDAYAEKDSRVKALHKQNGGLSCQKLWMQSRPWQMDYVCGRRRLD